MTADAERLRLLLAQGLDPDARDRRGVSLCAEAAEAGDAARVRVLLAAGASPDPAPALLEPDGAGGWIVEWPFQVPLFLAAAHYAPQGPACVEVLLAAGASVRVRSRELRTALFHARAEATLRLLLAAGLRLDDVDRYGWPVLTAAVVDGDVGRVRALLAVGADPNERHDRGYTAFMSAASSIERSPELLRVLLDAGADPHAVTELGWNAFHAAVDVNGEANAESSVRATLGLLRELGVDLHHRDRNGVTPLARARCFGTALEVRVLEELGARE